MISWSVSRLNGSTPSGSWLRAFSEDGERLATGSLDGTARGWNVTSGEVVLTPPSDRATSKVSRSVKRGLGSR